NWQNGILKNERATWLENGDSKHGGYFVLSGDVLLNIHNLLGEYNQFRVWNLSVYPRMGAFVAMKNKDGSPLLGFGVNNTFRLTDKINLNVDASYQVISSAMGEKTDVGSGSNGFFDISVGLELSLSSLNCFYKVSNLYGRNRTKEVVINEFWDNWFIQAGLGMSLLNRYGSNFAEVFPNGKTFGVNLGLGKWFTPEVGLRGGLNWQNGIIGNDHLEWMDPKDKPGGNHDGGGYGAVYMDVFFNLHHLFGSYDESRKWNAIVFPRVGLDSNLEAGSASPLVGIGTEQTFKLNDRLKLFVDVAYQFTTGELMGKQSKTGAGTGSNGWFDLNAGVQYEFGCNTWGRLGEKRPASANVIGHNWPRFIVNTGASVVVAYGVKSVLKKVIKEERPDHSDNQSFPSGHASMAFALARSIDKEFRKESIWIPIAGYAAATAVGIERIASDRHHWYDVVAGAGIGIGTAELTWWVSDKLFGSKSSVMVGSSGNTLDVTYNL
ncbi:MAG: phosphatase PAP2 family protein, partial [Prevotella sp.]|nr:phosphatase PAP2 family protein [Prevotella sp.]